MSVRCPQIHTKTPTEVRLLAIDYTRKLRSGELLTGTPTVTVSPSGPTTSSAAVNTTALDVNGNTCAAGEAVTFLVSGGTAGTDYTILASCGTDSTPAETIEAECILKVKT